MDDLEKRIEKLEKIVADNYSILSRICLDIEGMRIFVSSHDDQLVNKVDIANHESVVSNFKDSIKNVQEAIVSLKNDKEYLKNNLHLNELETDKVKNTLEDHKKIHENLPEAFKAIESYIKKIRDEVNNNFHDRITKEVHVLTKKISGIIIPSDYVSMLEVKTELSKAFETPLIDLGNAMITTENHEMRLEKVEKKIQNLFLMSENRKLKENK